MTSSDESTADKAVVLLTAKNSFSQSVDAARAWVFVINESVHVFLILQLDCLPLWSFLYLDLLLPTKENDPLAKQLRDQANVDPFMISLQKYGKLD